VWVRHANLNSITAATNVFCAIATCNYDFILNQHSSCGFASLHKLDATNNFKIFVWIAVITALPLHSLWSFDYLLDEKRLQNLRTGFLISSFRTKQYLSLKAYNHQGKSCLAMWAKQVIFFKGRQALRQEKTPLLQQARCANKCIQAGCAWLHRKALYGLLAAITLTINHECWTAELTLTVFESRPSPS